MTALAPSRRAFLRCGAVTVLAPQALIAAACTAETPDAAHAPWTLWDAPSVRGTPLALVAAGILAANPHDTQPWLFHIGTASSTSSLTSRATSGRWILIFAKCTSAWGARSRT
jgi:hypothetical protein